MLSPFCDPDNATVWLYVAMAVFAAFVVGFGYGHWARSRVPGGGLINAQPWPIVLLSIAFPFVATLLAAVIHNAVFPTVDYCGTTDRHELPILMTLATFPSIWFAAVIACRRKAP